MPTRDTARIGVDVVAGVLPGQPMEKYTRRWFITSSEWNAASDDRTGLSQARLLADVAGKANAWATYLMLQPTQFNWVKTEWIWY